MHIKICGLTRPEDIAVAVEAGVDSLGFNFYPKSPRYLPTELARDLIQAVPSHVRRVGLFVDSPRESVLAICRSVGLEIAQTYPDPTSEPVDLEEIVSWPAFRVKDVETLTQIRGYLDRARDLGRLPPAVLLDSYVAGVMGGSGHTAPWDLIAGFDPGVPIILAGGLTPETVATAIRTVQPWGVDVASGVESAPGRKDPDRVRSLIRAVRSVCNDAASRKLTPHP